MSISDLSPEQQELQRKKWRDSQQKTRNKKREAKSEETNPLEAQRIQKMEEEGLKRHQKLGICFFGEDRPGHDADTIESALAVCREFARALGEQDIQTNETLAQFEKRVGQVWMERGGPFLIRSTQTLTETGWGRGYWLDHCGGFDKSWKFLPGAERPIDVSGLAPLKEIPKPKPETKPVEISQVPTSTEVLARGRVQLLNQLRMQNDPTLSPDAHRYLYGT